MIHGITLCSRKSRLSEETGHKERDKPSQTLGHHYVSVYLGYLGV